MGAGRWAAGQRALLATAIVFEASACAPLAKQATRPARSSLGCIETVLAERISTYEEDAQAHCLAAGLIARYCSPSEAFIASVGKEIKDLFSAGDPQWRDLQADRRGMRCARSANTDSELRQCCNQASMSY